MKSKYIKFGVLAVALFTLPYIGCKDALEIPPPTQSELTYFTSEAEFKAAMLGAYASLTDFYSTSSSSGGSGNAMLQCFYLPGDDVTSDNSNNNFEIFGGGINSGNVQLGRFYQSNYLLIGRANKVLEKLETVASTVFTTPNLQDNMKGEALFLRAFGEYQLWNTFGTSPIVTKVANSLSDVNVPSSKGTQLLDQAVTDLTSAASLLPASWDAANRGRITQNAANALLGKILVYRATVNKTVADYQAALTAFNKISGVSLVANYQDNFDVDKENNVESLFEFQAGSDRAPGNGSANAWLANDGADVGVGGAYYQMYTNNENGSYMSDGQFLPTVKLKNAFEANDPRLASTLTADKNNIVKYILKNRTEAGVISLNNFRILRFAEVLLLKAEATLQSGGSTSDAIDFINQVRTRARNMVTGGTIPANFSTAETSKTTIMQWIMDENLRELCSEGTRWWDLRRWHIGGTITINNAFLSSRTPGNMKFDTHFLYFPIPGSELNVNPNVIQNPDY